MRWAGARHIVPSPKSIGVLSRWPEQASVQRLNWESCPQKWAISWELSLMSREEAWFLEHWVRSDSQGFWILGLGCQISAPEIPPPASQNWVVGTWLSWTCSWGQMTSLGPREVASAWEPKPGLDLFWVLRFSPGCFSLQQPLALAGMEERYTPLPLCPRLFSSSPLFSVRGSWQAWSQVADLADLTDYYGPATILVFKAFPSFFSILRSR